jgi:transposase-like protein
MTPNPSLPTCPNPACEQPHVIRNGSSNGRRRYHSRGCDRFFGETAGTPMYRLHTPAADIPSIGLIRPYGSRVRRECVGIDSSLRLWL